MANILHVDDSIDFALSLAVHLRDAGHHVQCIGNGREALLSVLQEIPDVLVLDLMMPDMDGWEVYQQMKADEKTRHIPVIVVTAKAQSIDKVLGLHIAKVDDYLAKPFSPQDLLSSVERVLKTKS